MEAFLNVEICPFPKKKVIYCVREQHLEIVSYLGEQRSPHLQFNVLKSA